MTIIRFVARGSCVIGLAVLLGGCVVAPDDGGYGRAHHRDDRDHSWHRCHDRGDRDDRDDRDEHCRR